MNTTPWKFSEQDKREAISRMLKVLHRLIIIENRILEIVESPVALAANELWNTLRELLMHSLTMDVDEVFPNIKAYGKFWAQEQELKDIEALKLEYVMKLRAKQIKADGTRIVADEKGVPIEQDREKPVVDELVDLTDVGVETEAPPKAHHILQTTVENMPHLKQAKSADALVAKVAPKCDNAARKDERSIFKKPKAKTQLSANRTNFEDESAIVTLGAHGTTVFQSALNKINSTWDHRRITKKIMALVFDRYTLAFSNLSGQESPAHKGAGKPEKNRLDPAKVADIIEFMVNHVPNIRTQDVRAAIVSKCADEQKMYRQKKAKENMRAAGRK